MKDFKPAKQKHQNKHSFQKVFPKESLEEANRSVSKRKPKNLFLRIPSKNWSDSDIDSSERKKITINTPVTNSKYLEVWKRVKAKLHTVITLKELAKNLHLYGSTPTSKIENLPRFSSDYFDKNPKIQDFYEEETQKEVPFCLFHPSKKPKIVWNVIVAVLLIYTATVMPFSMAFVESEPWDVLYTFDLVLDALFFLDVIVNIFSCYTDEEGKLVTNRKKIFIKYLRSWMLIDLAACFPFSLIRDDEESTYSSSGEYNNFLRLLRLPRLYRLFRITRLLKMIKHYKHSEILEKIQDFLSLKHSAMRLFNSFLTIILGVHIVSCFWYYLARLEGFHPGTWVIRGGYQDEGIGSLYVTSMYWAFTTLSTVGYGDINSHTNLEKIFSMIWMFFGLYFFSFTIGSLSSMLANMDTKENALINKLAVIDEFSKEANLDKKLKHRLRLALRYSTEKKGISWADKKSIFNELPKHLRYQMAMAMYSGAIRKITFFANKEAVVIASIVPFLQPMFVKFKDLVYKKQEYADEIYFIVKGNVELKKFESECSFQVIHQGNYFGDIEVMLGIPRKYYSYALSDLELMILTKEIINQIEIDFPKIYTEMKSVAKERYESYERIVLEIEEIEFLKMHNMKIDSESVKLKVEKRLKRRKREELMNMQFNNLPGKKELSLFDVWKKLEQLEGQIKYLSKDISRCKPPSINYLERPSCDLKITPIQSSTLVESDEGDCKDF